MKIHNVRQSDENVGNDVILIDLGKDITLRS